MAIDNKKHPVQVSAFRTEAGVFLCIDPGGNKRPKQYLATEAEWQELTKAEAPVQDWSAKVSATPKAKAAPVKAKKAKSK